MNITKTHHKPNLIIEFGLLSLLATLWGGSYSLLKIAIVDITPLTLIAIRVFFACLFLYVVMLHNNRKLPSDITTWRKLFLLAVFNSIASWAILAWSMQYVDSGLASVLNSTTPVFVFFLTWAITRHEVVNGLKLFGACLGVLGVVLIVGVDVLAGLGLQVTAQLGALIGAFLYACAAVYGNRIDLPPVVVATGTMVCASVVLVPLCLLLEHPWTLKPSLGSLCAALALSIICTGVAFLIYFRLLRTLGSLGVASQAYLRAGVGVFLGMVFLGETISLPVAAGLSLCLVGVVVINLPKTTRKIENLGTCRK